MMSQSYAVIDNEVVVNVIIWDGDKNFNAPDNHLLVNLADNNDSPGIGWSYSNGTFTAPPQPEKTHDELVAEAEQQKSTLLITASNVIAPLQDATDLDMATDNEKEQLLAWKKYRVLVNRVDTSTAPGITWPTSPDDESTTSTSTDTTTGDVTTS